MLRKSGCRKGSRMAIFTQLRRARCPFIAPTIPHPSDPYSGHVEMTARQKTPLQRRAPRSFGPIFSLFIIYKSIWGVTEDDFIVP